MAGRTTKKTENVEAVTETVALEEQSAPEKKNTTRKTKETAPEEKKTTAKSKTATKKAATEKKTTKAAATKKATTKKTATAKKAETPETKETKRKTTTKKVEKSVVFEFHGVQTQINVEDYENKVKDMWLNDWNRLAKDLTSIDLYIKPEDGKVYFVINGTEHGAIDM